MAWLASATRGEKATTGFFGAAYGVGVGGGQGSEAGLCLGHQVTDQDVDDAADGLVAKALGRDIEAGPAGFGQGVTHDGEVGDIGRAEQAEAHAVIEVVAVIGDVVAHGGDLGFGRGVGAEHQILPCVVGGDVGGGFGERAVVLDQAFEGLPGEVQAVERGVAGFQAGDDAKGLCVVVEAAKGLHAGVERILAGVAEGRVAEIVGQGQGIGEVLVETELAGDGAGDLGHFEAVGEPGAVEIAHVVDEDLGFVLQLAEGGAVDDAVPVPLPGAAGGSLRLMVKAAARGFGADGVFG